MTTLLVSFAAGVFLGAFLGLLYAWGEVRQAHQETRDAIRKQRLGARRLEALLRAAARAEELRSVRSDLLRPSKPMLSVIPDEDTA